MPAALPGIILLAALGLPVALFDLGFATGVVSFLSCVALGLGFALWLRRLTGVSLAPGGRFDAGMAALCFGISALLCLLGGELHLFSPTFDWMVRDAVLHDLVIEPWPVHYEIAGRDFLLRAPLGMYLLPAAVGKIFGLIAAHYVLFLQNTLVLGSLFLVFTATCRTWRARALILGVFVIFSGLDVLPCLIEGRLPEWHLEVWVAALQYSSHLTQLFWVPHHALAGWSFVAAYLLWRRGSLSALSLGAIFTLCLFWSPLAMMGALPFLIFALVSDWRGARLHLRDALGPGLILLGSLPAVFYLMLDSGAVEKRWLFIDHGYPFRYVAFILIELGLWLWIFHVRPKEDSEAPQQGDILIAIILLLLFPLYSIGFSNDFTMRASIPALAIVALAAAPRIGAMLQARDARRVVLIAGLVTAAITPAVEVARAIAKPTIPLGDCTLPSAWKAWEMQIGIRNVSMATYLASTDSGSAKAYFAVPARRVGMDQPCGPTITAFPFRLHEAPPQRVDLAVGTPAAAKALKMPPAWGLSAAE